MKGREKTERFDRRECDKDKGCAARPETLPCIRIALARIKEADRRVSGRFIAANRGLEEEASALCRLIEMEEAS